MTHTQAQRATETPFALCVVPLEDRTPTIEIVRTQSRFVPGIGTLLKEKVNQVQEVKTLQLLTGISSEGISVDIEDSQIRYRVDERVTGASNVAVTVKVSYANADQFSMAILDYANVGTLDAISTSGGTTGMPVTSGSAITHQPNELILGVAVADVNVTAASGFNSRFTSPYFVVEDKIVSSTGSYSATFNTSTSIANEGWDAGMATFY
jgi:hypothetical protein